MDYYDFYHDWHYSMEDEVDLEEVSGVIQNDEGVFYVWVMFILSYKRLETL